MGPTFKRLLREKKQQEARKSHGPPHPTHYERARLMGKKVGKYESQREGAMDLFAQASFNNRVLPLLFSFV